MGIYEIRRAADLRGGDNMRDRRQATPGFSPLSTKEEDALMPEETLTITDNRTGKSYTVPLFKGTLRAMELRHIKTGGEDFGLMTYDPAFLNTASCESAITFIDGDKGILEYRGYPIEDLAEHCTFLEVAYLLIHGELPTDEQYSEWTGRIGRHTLLHE